MREELENGRKYHLVNWGHVCKSKEMEDFWGGVVMDLKYLNLAILTKWWWKFLTNPQGAVQKLLSSKYGPRRGSRHAKVRAENE